MARTRIRTSLAALAAAALLATAGCGVDQSDEATQKVAGNDTKTENSGSTDGGDITIESGTFEGTGGAVFLNEAAEATSAVDTQKIYMNMTMTGVPEVGDITIEANGEVDNTSGLSHMTMDMSSVFGAMGDEAGLPADAGMMEVIVDGDTTYMKSSLFSMLGDDSKPWMKVPTEDQGSVTSGAPSDPSKFLEFLENTGSEIEEVGTEEVRGVETTHIRTVLDTEALLADAPEEDKAEMQAQLDELGGAFDEIPVEAWVGEDGMVRRITMTFDFAATGDAELGNTAMDITVEMYDFGEPVDISVPDPSEVSDLDATGMAPGN